MTGTLYIVSTPIGNLEDIGFRAVRILKEVETIAAEDTRHTRKLLNHLQIDTPLTSYHDHNKERKTPVLIQRMKDGASFALVCDAGTPTLSDPGYYLITKAIAAGIAVSPIPGPSALTAALAISGLPTDRFVFEGFLPRKKGRTKRLEALSNEERTIVIYESPHRIASLLKAVQAHMGARRVAVCRELTKVYEAVIRGEVSEVIALLDKQKVKGEVTLVVEGSREKKRMNTGEVRASKAGDRAIPHGR
ncbi:MAG: 16S rRNA (cytidine(1402)-2'-O)-methyltransferase [Nitrospiria bacterium]